MSSKMRIGTAEAQGLICAILIEDLQTLSQPVPEATPSFS